jgi:hypothetical protein
MPIDLGEAVRLQHRKYLQERAGFEARTTLGRVLLRIADQLADGAGRLADGPPIGTVKGERQSDNRRESSFVLILLGDQCADEVLGDLEEVYWSERTMRGGYYARLRYVQRLFGLIARKLLRTAVRLALNRDA